MGFNNPVSNAAGTLIRRVMQSLGFVTGVTGWQIAKNGNAEFNAATFRGTIIAGPVPGGHVVIGPGGVIMVFDGTNTLVAQIDGNGIETFASNGSAVLSVNGTTEWIPPTSVHTIIPGFARGISGGGLSELQVVGPSEDVSTFADTSILMIASRASALGGAMIISSQSVTVSNDAPGGGASVICGNTTQPGALQLQTRGGRAYAVTSPPTDFPCSATLTLTSAATAVLIPGCAASYIKLGLNARWQVIAKLDSAIGTVAVTNVAELWVSINGAAFVKQTAESDIATGANTRVPGIGVWSGTGGNNNTNNTLDFELRGRYVGGAGGTNQFMSPHTVMQVAVYE